MDRVFNLYLALVPIIFIPFLVLIAALMIAVLVYLKNAQWYRAMSVLVAPFVGAAIFYLLLKSGLSADLLLLESRKSVYLEEVNKLADPSGTRLKTWDFGRTGGAGSSSSFYCLVYDESGDIMRPPAQWSDAWRSKAKQTCLISIAKPSDAIGVRSSTSVRHLDGHFYLLTETFD